MSRIRVAVVAAVLLLVVNATTGVAQGDPCASSPEVVYYNAAIITMDTERPTAEAMAVRADTIMAVGTAEDVLALQIDGCGARAVDVGGLTLLPGFNDAHSHWFSWSEHICSVTEETTYPPLEEIMSMLSANGWSSISELNFGRPDFAPEHLENALRLDSAGELSVRLNGYWGTLDDVSMIDVLANAGRESETYYSERVRAPGVKLYVDNPFGAVDILTQEEVNQLVTKAHNAGWQVAAHAVNESAVEKIISAYEKVLGSESNAVHRHRIEHAVKVTDDQLIRMEQKGIIASFQLLGPADWPTQSDFGDRFLGDHPEWTMRWNDFVDAESAGLKIVGSTDAPFNDAPCDYSPFEIIYQAVARDGYIDRMPAAWELNQRISVEDAIRLLTIDGAYATSEESVKGSLTTGKYADFVVVSDNPIEAGTLETLRDIETLMTVVGGTIEYCDESAIEDVCSPAEIFLVDEGAVSASSYLPDQTPNFAFDENLDTNWGSGEYPPQWIQIDLGSPEQIAGIDLVVEQFPAGRSFHEIWARADGPAAEFVMLHRFNQETESGDTLSYEAPSDLPAYRTLRVETSLSLSWVSWREIMIRRPSATSAEDDRIEAPTSFGLKQNYPNPFNPSTTITFQIPAGTSGALSIFDIFGRRVRSWNLTAGSSGLRAVSWDGTNDSGQPAASGVYLSRLKAGDLVDNRQMILSK